MSDKYRGKRGDHDKEEEVSDENPPLGVDSNDLADEDGVDHDAAVVEPVSARFGASERRPNLIPIDEEADEFFFGADSGASVDTSQSPNEPSDLSQHLPGAYRIGHNLLVTEDDTTLGTEGTRSPSTAVAAPEEPRPLPAELVTQTPLVSAAPVPSVPEVPVGTNCWGRRRNRYWIAIAFLVLIIGCLVLALIAAIQPSLFHGGDSSPSEQPSASPAPSQSFSPTISPSHSPSLTPTISPSHLPSGQPTVSPPTSSPLPTTLATSTPMVTAPPLAPTLSPSTSTPTMTAPPTNMPSASPSQSPTKTPQPTVSPQPSPSPSTSPPSMVPSQFPSSSPTNTVSPSLSPSNSLRPSTSPTDSPIPTSQPSAFPTITPVPTASPSLAPTAEPTFVNVTIGQRRFSQRFEISNELAFNETEQALFCGYMDSLTPEFSNVTVDGRIQTDCVINSQQRFGVNPGVRRQPRLSERHLQEVINDVAYTMTYTSQVENVTGYPVLFRTFINSNLDNLTLALQDLGLQVVSSQPALPALLTDPPNESPTTSMPSVNPSAFPTLPPSATPPSPTFEPTTRHPTVSQGSRIGTGAIIGIAVALCIITI